MESKYWLEVTADGGTYRYCSADADVSDEAFNRLWRKVKNGNLVSVRVKNPRYTGV